MTDNTPTPQAGDDLLERLLEQSKSVDMFRDQIRAMCAEAASAILTLQSQLQEQANKQLSTITVPLGMWVSHATHKEALERAERAEALIVEQDKAYGILVKHQRERAEAAEARLKSLTSPEQISGEVVIAVALKKLANEAGGLSAFENEIRAVIGNTNWECLKTRIDEADAALRALLKEGDAR